MQPTDLSAGLKLGRVVSTVVGGPGKHTPQDGGAKIGVLDPGMMAPEGGVGY